MQVRLIAKTSGASEGLSGKSLGEIIAYVARVSNPGNQANDLTASKLLTYCLREGHVSVFETCSLTLEIDTSLAIATQILRHRSFTFQQFSLRYSESSMGYEPSKARRQDAKNRQNSIDDLDEDIVETFNRYQEVVWNTAHGLYLDALNRGVAKEVGRMLLPQNTKTRLYMTGSVRSWIHYCVSRCARGVQKEHKDIAEEALRILLQEVPELSDYFDTLRKENE